MELKEFKKKYKRIDYRLWNKYGLTAKEYLNILKR